MRKLVFGVYEDHSTGSTTRSDTNRPVHSQKKARSLKIQIYKEEGLYCLCTENKGADLCLCFRIDKNPVFS